MDVKLLEAFRAVVDSRSVTAAAQALGITQPAVSGQIAKLEESVGFPLFERAGGRLKPTPEGLLFYAEATRVLGEVDRLAATTAQIREGQSGRLVIASHPAAAISMLPPLVAAFVAERPGVSVRLVSRHSDVVSQLLPTEGYDLGIAELPVDETAVRLVRYQMRCVAILPPRHALASRKLLTPALLSGQPMIAPARSPQMLSRVYGTFAGADAQINAVVEAEFFASLLRAGRGRHRLVAGRSPVGAELQPSRPGDAAVRARGDLRDRRLPSPRPRAVGARRGLPRIARIQARERAMTMPINCRRRWRRASPPIPSCGATSTTSAIAADGSPAPRARRRPSPCCASACARPRPRTRAARSPCPTTAGSPGARPCACRAARWRRVIRWCARSPRRRTGSPPR